MKKSTTSAIKRPPQPSRPSNWQYYTIITTCCIVLVAGFFFAARQHFSSIEYGLNNSRLRKQLDELQSEKRRLLVAREISLTPVELRKAAYRMGVVETLATQGETRAAFNPFTKRSLIKASEPSSPPNGGHGNKVVATVISAPVNKAERLDKQPRRETYAIRTDRP